VNTHHQTHTGKLTRADLRELVWDVRADWRGSSTVSDMILFKPSEAEWSRLNERFERAAALAEAADDSEPEQWLSRLSDLVNAGELETSDVDAVAVAFGQALSQRTDPVLEWTMALASFDGSESTTRWPRLSTHTAASSFTNRSNASTSPRRHIPAS